MPTKRISRKEADVPISDVRFTIGDARVGEPFVPDKEYLRQNGADESDTRPRYPIVLAKNDEVPYGASVDLSKLDVRRYRKNPILQWAHPSPYRCLLYTSPSPRDS